MNLHYESTVTEAEYRERRLKYLTSEALLRTSLSVLIIMFGLVNARRTKLEESDSLISVYILTIGISFTIWSLWRLIPTIKSLTSEIRRNKTNPILREITISPKYYLNGVLGSVLGVVAIISSMLLIIVGHQLYIMPELSDGKLESAVTMIIGAVFLSLSIISTIYCAMNSPQYLTKPEIELK